jgi:hypothetical protein
VSANRHEIGTGGGVAVALQSQESLTGMPLITSAIGTHRTSECANRCSLSGGKADMPVALRKRTVNEGRS